MRSKFALSVLFSVVVFGLFAQSPDPASLKELVSRLKSDVRGPYRDIRWFCTDGSIRQPRDPCPDAIGPGNQHARYKPEIEALAAQHGIYLGQILTYTAPEDFWDVGNEHRRLKHYQLESYLKGVDNGWIHQRAQFYRGAIQAEDETAWGKAFFQDLLARQTSPEQDFFLIRQAMKDVPHGEDTDVAQRMRSQSKELSDLLPAFMDLRVKIHGQPEATDIRAVEQFLSRQGSGFDPALRKRVETLLQTMRTYHNPPDWSIVATRAQALPESDIKAQLMGFRPGDFDSQDSKGLIKKGAELLFQIREALPEADTGQVRMQLLDLSLQLEALLMREAPKWEPGHVGDLMEKICYLGMAATGSGYLERWEWDQLATTLGAYQDPAFTLGEVHQFAERARSQVEWSSAMFRAQYETAVQTFGAFEPLALGFVDDRVRGSILLQLGNAVGRLGAFVADQSGLRNKVLDLTDQSSFRGLNPGYALGTLEVLRGAEGVEAVERDRIYAFGRPPSDLKPVAGIATVSEGNMVSHVQLLARNLGIPNAALSDANLAELGRYHGQRIFYAVSNRGSVLMKLEAEMTPEEQALFAQAARSEERIRVPTDSLKLDVHRVLNLREVDKEDSGILCGPKAANLGALKHMFPDHVVEGLVIPFGIFRWHMEQPMPGQQGTYWSFLEAAFTRARQMEADGAAEDAIEHYLLEQLRLLREALAKIPFHESFVAELHSGFQNVLNAPMGEVPVFLRSDTNMEDLKDFTGAGLNLTLFNVRETEKILEGIRSVWASPYTERSFRWRQRYLLNPENVFPSILIIPSVNVDYSGVLITKGVTSGASDELTVAFSRGVGGAVEGQAAEQYRITAQGEAILLAPARETHYTALPDTGGTTREHTTLERPILSQVNLEAIRTLAREVTQKMKERGDSGFEGPHDIELGFRNNKLWLFQIRPFVENKRAVRSEYLESITPKIDSRKRIPSNTEVQ